MDNIRFMKDVLKNLRYHLFKKKYGSIGYLQIFRFLKKMFFYSMFIYIPLTAVAAVTNNFVVKDERYAGIMLSGYAFSDYDYWVSPIAFFAAFVSSRFSSHQIRVCVSKSNLTAWTWVSRRRLSPALRRSADQRSYRLK